MNMPEALIQKISKPILDKLKSKAAIFGMFKELDTGPEDWFRVEILDAIWKLNKLQVRATNQKYKTFPGRPDFILEQNGEEKAVELKVLPVDRNYPQGYGRFCAGKTNKADFDALSNGEVALVIYVHWPSSDDFEKTRRNLERRYSVTCHTAESFEYQSLSITISFWKQRNA
jgi:hypothetical protein